MAQSTTLVAPSILSADFGHLAEELRRIESGGGDWIHLDIMDGVFVPNITFGSQMVAALRPESQLPFDTHLMIVNPANYVSRFAEAGSDIITVHYEATVHVHRVLSQIRELGKKVGISIVPSTPALMLTELLPELDLIRGGWWNQQGNLQEGGRRRGGCAGSRFGRVRRREY
jgi:ribulose-phosphate 3-epimerase